MSLQQTIAEWQTENMGRIPPEVREVMQSVTRELVASGIAEQALGPGEEAPSFTLRTAAGRTVSLDRLLREGPVVLNFYRGAWCPYCNLELQALNRIAPAIRERDATLVSINPNLPERSESFVAENPFDFDILCDPENRVARRYRLVFSLPNRLIAIYRDFGIDLPAFDGNDRWELPMPATYVVTPERRIGAAFVHADYTRRMEPEDILAYLDQG